MIENLEGEIWKDVVGYEGIYMVSTCGRIQLLKRTVYFKSNNAKCGFSSITKRHVL